jgi:hypothetical protein
MTSRTGANCQSPLFLGVRSIAIAVLLVAALPAAMEFSDVAFERIPTRDTILIQAEVNGRAATFIVDTGSTYTIVEPRLVALSRETAGQATLLRGIGISGEGTWVVATIRIGSKTWRRQRILAMSLEAVSRVYGRHIDGILGQDVLRSVKSVLIDNAAQRIVLTW